MKILYLSTARLPDEWAHGVQIMKMCEAFAAAGHAVELVVPRRAATMKVDPFAYYGIRNNFSIKRLFCMDFFPGTQGKLFFLLRNFTFLLSARLYLYFISYDVLYTREHFFLPYLPLKKTALELHTIPENKRFWDLAKRIPHIIAITQGIKDDLVKRAVPAQTVTVAPDAVDLDAFEHPENKTAARVRLGLPADEKIALYLGRLDAWKGIETLYAAADLLSDDIRIAVIGGEKSEVSALTAKYPKILFLGFRPYREAADNQAAADILLLPNTAKNALSARYTSPLKLFTYMAAGKPIIASDLPSIREILDDTSAVFVRPDDPAALAEGITQILRDSSRARTIAANARKKVEEYTWNKRARNILLVLA